MPRQFGMDLDGRAKDGRQFDSRLHCLCAAVASIGFMFATPAHSVGATIGPPATIGSIAATSLAEVSGIVDSRANANTFWVHNDSGDSARFYAINHQGTMLGTFPLAGATAFDWEDIAMSPKPGGGNYLYLGDIGDNAIRFARLSPIYRTDEPQSTASATIPVARLFVGETAVSGRCAQCRIAIRRSADEGRITSLRKRRRL